MVTKQTRYGRTEEVAAAAVFFASDQSSWCNGSSLVLDGGFHRFSPLSSRTLSERHPITIRARIHTMTNRAVYVLPPGGLNNLESRTIETPGPGCG